MGALISFYSFVQVTPVCCHAMVCGGIVELHTGNRKDPEILLALGDTGEILQSQTLESPWPQISIPISVTQLIGAFFSLF
jgi:hypothetical protein